MRLDINGAPVDELTQRPANVEHPGAVCDRDYVAYEVWREYERGKVWRKWYKKSIDERKQKKQKQVDDEVNRVVYAEDGDGEAAFRRWILDRDRVAVQERGL